MATGTRPPHNQTVRKRNSFTMILIVLGALIVMGLGLLFAAYSYVNHRYDLAPDPSATNTVVFDVPRGSGLSSIAARLEAEGLVQNADLFKLVTMMRGNVSVETALSDDIQTRRRHPPALLVGRGRSEPRRCRLRNRR